MLNSYELALVLNATLGQEKQKKILDEIGKLLSSTGKIDSSQALGKKVLAYPIKKEKEGFYWILTLVAEGVEVKNLTNKLKLKDDILRFLIIRR